MLEYINMYIYIYQPRTQSAPSSSGRCSSWRSEAHIWNMYIYIYICIHTYR